MQQLEPVQREARAMPILPHPVTCRRDEARVPLGVGQYNVQEVAVASGSSVSSGSANGAGGDTRSPDQLVDDIEVVRERLAATIDQITDRANPKNIAQRKLDDLKARFLNRDGSPRMETILPVAGAVVGAITLIVVIRHFVRD